LGKSEGQSLWSLTGTEVEKRSQAQCLRQCRRSARWMDRFFVDDFSFSVLRTFRLLVVWDLVARRNDEAHIISSDTRNPTMASGGSSTKVGRVSYPHRFDLRLSVPPTCRIRPFATRSSPQSPSDFLANAIGRPVSVRLNSGVDYRGASTLKLLRRHSG
jgi:hypothetical protein